MFEVESAVLIQLYVDVPFDLSLINPPRLRPRWILQCLDYRATGQQ
jgi:hypothetical protein